MKTKISEFKFNSQSSNKEYTTIKYDDGSFSCNCPSWIFKRGDVRNCKHIDEVKCKEANVEATINISELNNQHAVVKDTLQSHD